MGARTHACYSSSGLKSDLDLQIEQEHVWDSRLLLLDFFVVVGAALAVRRYMVMATGAGRGKVLVAVFNVITVE